MLSLCQGMRGGVSGSNVDVMALRSLCLLGRSWMSPTLWKRNGSARAIMHGAVPGQRNRHAMPGPVSRLLVICSPGPVERTMLCHVT